MPGNYTGVLACRRSAVREAGHSGVASKVAECRERSTTLQRAETLLRADVAVKGK